MIPWQHSTIFNIARDYPDTAFTGQKKPMLTFRNTFSQDIPLFQLFKCVWNEILYIRHAKINKKYREFIDLNWYKFARISNRIYEKMLENNF